jgi:hypothetical protein
LPTVCTFQKWVDASGNTVGLSPSLSISLSGNLTVKAIYQAPQTTTSWGPLIGVLGIVGVGAVLATSKEGSSKPKYRKNRISKK